MSFVRIMVVLNCLVVVRNYGGLPRTKGVAYASGMYQGGGGDIDKYWMYKLIFWIHIRDICHQNTNTHFAFFLGATALSAKEKRVLHK